jgi:tyrosyl-tRNA synthetase
MVFLYLTMADFIDELSWRGMLQDITPGLKERLTTDRLTGYIGFDPTADSLHIGSLATIMLLVHLQRAGHKPIALIGGATGMIGDPSGKSAERVLLSEEAIRHNAEGIRKQLERFLDFSPGPAAAEVVNNLDWFGPMSAIQFLRQIGKHLTINYMMAKDSVRKRLETGMSFTEFSYMLLQGYDFQWLYEHKGVCLQMGGSDQWGNITAGTELIRRMGGEKEAYALTTPLLTRADGSKFGKTEGGNIWLDSTRTSPYQFFQYFINTPDEEGPVLLRRLTLLGRGEIENLEARHNENPGNRLLQNRLAEEVTRLVHGETGLETARITTGVLFGNAGIDPLLRLSEDRFRSVLQGVPEIRMEPDALGLDWATLLSESSRQEIFPSKAEVRKMVQQGGVQVNKQKISADSPKPSLLLNRFLLVQKGKKNYFLLDFSGN